MQTQQTGASDCSVLILSCDQYRDLWTPFLTLFERYWAGCEMPVYLGTDEAPAPTSIRVLHSGKDVPWSRRLRLFLQTIATPYVLLLLEDFFIDRPVSNSQIRAELTLLRERQGTCLRLFPNPPADYFQDGIGVIHQRAAFRISLQAAIWNKARLLDLLVDEESIWDFELRGTRRSRQWPTGFYCTAAPVIHYQHVLEQGEWYRAAARFYKAEDIGCDFKARSTMGFLQTWKKKPANTLRRVLNRVRSRWLCLRHPEKAPHAE